MRTIYKKVLNNRLKKKRKESLSEMVIIFIITSDLEKLSKLTARVIAKTFNTNYSYLIVKFREDTKISLHEYIVNEKIRRAENLLKTRPELSIADISELIGYCKPTYFREHFKKRFGINPHKYRKLVKSHN